MSQQTIIAVGDTITTKLIGTNGVPLTEAKPHLITSTHINHALLTTHFSALPKRTRLLQNYPNPFNPETWLPYQLASAAEVTINIYDIRGRLIRHLNLGQKPAGLYLNRENAAYWDGRSETSELVSSGLYFYQLRANDYLAAKRMAIVK